MADTANSVLAINMVSGIDVVHKDARFLNSDDIRNEMHDLLVFEVSARPDHHALLDVPH